LVSNVLNPTNVNLSFYAKKFHLLPSERQWVALAWKISWFQSMKQKNRLIFLLYLLALAFRIGLMNLKGAGSGWFGC
jgi:hypothetical protein